jgi:hypothetical protein
MYVTLVVDAQSSLIRWLQVQSTIVSSSPQQNSLTLLLCYCMRSLVCLYSGDAGLC